MIIHPCNLQKRETGPQHDRNYEEESEMSFLRVGITISKYSSFFTDTWQHNTSLRAGIHNQSLKESGEYFRSHIGSTYGGISNEISFSVLLLSWEHPKASNCSRVKGIAERDISRETRPTCCCHAWVVLWPEYRNGSYSISLETEERWRAATGCFIVRA